MLIENVPELSKMAPSSYTGLPFKMRCMLTLDHPVALDVLSRCKPAMKKRRSVKLNMS